MPTHPRPWLAHGVHPLRSALGGAVGIALTALIGVLGARYSAAHGFWGGGPFLLASLGASAVLVFAVPASPLAQPRAVLGGNVVSAVGGLCVAHVVTAPVPVVNPPVVSVDRPSIVGLVPHALSAGTVPLPKTAREFGDRILILPVAPPALIVPAVNNSPIDDNWPQTPV